MPIKFVKYHGAGNDFIMLDNRDEFLDRFLIPELIAGWCHRRFGIGADGVIAIETAERADFRMVYYNADGGEGSLCGNGARCVVAFAAELGVFQGESCSFFAYDGPHRGEVLGDGNYAVDMADAPRPEHRSETDFFIDTGSPHFVRFVKNLDEIDVEAEGKAIRHNAEFNRAGTNVNFVEIIGEDQLRIETFERGVEAVTYACGTGAVAAAICLAEFEDIFSNRTTTSTPLSHRSVLFSERSRTDQNRTDSKLDVSRDIQLKAKGGLLGVRYRFDLQTERFVDCRLTGPAVEVYAGKIETT